VKWIIHKLKGKFSVIIVKMVHFVKMVCFEFEGRMCEVLVEPAHLLARVLVILMGNRKFSKRCGQIEPVSTL
jgi:hypothetical protein